MKRINHDRNLVWLMLFVGFIAVYFYWFKSPVILAFDPNDEQCLPDVHLALLVKGEPLNPKHDDLIFWKPYGALGYVKQEYVLKKVAGITGDRVRVKNGVVTINGEVVSTGMPLINQKAISLKAFDRDEIIPAGFVYMMGTHPLSNDSRYWGLLPLADAAGQGHKLL